MAVVPARGQQNDNQTGQEVNTLRVLAVADELEPRLYRSTVAERLGAVDLLISCGDLPPYYLEYLSSALDAPLMHVLGNHCIVPHDSANRCSPLAYLGAYNLNGRVVSFTKLREEEGAGSCNDGRGPGHGHGPPLLLAGLEGSPWYNGGPHQHSEQEVAATLLKMVPGLILNKARTGRYLDILVTHAPPRGIHDDIDAAHKGFKVLLGFIERFKPALLLHGHTHRYQPLVPVRSMHDQTTIINTFGHVLLELESKDFGPFQLQDR